MGNILSGFTIPVVHGLINRVFRCKAVLCLLFVVFSVDQSVHSLPLDREGSLNALEKTLHKDKAPGSGIGEAISAGTRDYSKLPLYFIQNNGQMDERVKFYETGNGHTTLFTKKGVYLSFAKIIQIIPLDANEDMEIIAEGLQEGKVHYYSGNDSKDWKINIPTYETVVYKEIYKGIDIKFYGNNRQMEYDIIVKPGGDPRCVKFAVSGINDVGISEGGDLKIQSEEISLIQKRPYIYQMVEGRKVEIGGGFEILKPDLKTGDTKLCVYGFQIAPYDKKYSLIIDPALDYSSYFGGSGSDRGLAIHTDASGNIYFTGETRSKNFPTSSAFFKYNAGNSVFSDTFITKLDASGKGLVYSVFLGGSGNDIGSAITADAQGNAYITGFTDSADFPLASAMYDHRAGASDAFITKINKDGSALVYSTYLGGNKSEWGRGVAVDTGGNAYVTGWTFSENFPVTPAMNKIGERGFQDAFVTKVDSSGKGIVYSICIGGGKYDVSNGIAVDTDGNAYIAGYTNSPDFPLASPVFGTYTGGYHDAFVAKLNTSGNRMEYSTYLGGGSDDVAYAITVDSSKNALVTGLTWSNDFPLASALQKNIAGNDDVFVTKLDASGKIITYSTYLGGSSYDCGYGISTDNLGNAYVTGVTQSDDFPAVFPVYASKKGGSDAFVTELNNSGNRIVYSSYVGGSDDDAGYGISSDNSGNAYVIGQTSSEDFPVASATQRRKSGGSDIFISKIAVLKYKIYGYVTDADHNPIESVILSLKGVRTASPGYTTSADGYFEFNDLDENAYRISFSKNGYKKVIRKVNLQRGMVKVIMVEMKKE